jgi:hypothetical protein
MFYFGYFNLHINLILLSIYTDLNGTVIAESDGEKVTVKGSK